MSSDRQLDAAAVGRIPVRNAWHMLLYAWDLASWRDSARVGTEGAPSLLGLLALVLEDSTRRLLLRQLGREHLSRRGAVKGIRGRVDFGHSLKRLHFQSNQAVCEFPELSTDTARNRILKATLHRLTKDPRVDHDDPRRAAELRARLGDLVGRMEGIALVNLAGGDFSRLQLGRNDREYELPLRICDLLFRLKMPTEQRGDHALIALVRDEQEFRALFERFVRNFYRYCLKGFEVRSEALDWSDEIGSEYVPSMRTDITLTDRSRLRKIVIDTKFSATTLQSTRFSEAKFRSEHLYQIYAYLRTQEHKSAMDREASGILLYPTTAGDVDAAMRVQGHTIRVATVDLSTDWRRIEMRLLGLVQNHPA